MGGLDAFTKTYYHLPGGVGVVDEKSLAGGGGGGDAKKSAVDCAAMMQECRNQVHFLYFITSPGDIWFMVYNIQYFLEYYAIHVVLCGF